MSKPSIPQGTRDFSPEEVRKRQYIFDTIRNTFELYGFQPIETPAMEKLETLTGKYGEEGDRLIFKILNNGLHEKNDADKQKLNAEWNKILEKPYSSPVVTERALRYDLTIPFARYVAMHQNDIAFPFRRYQMQPVWRADRPQKGRYREFWQCDADIVGSTSLINEAELLCIYEDVFRKLNIPVSIKINSRKILAGIAEYCGVSDKLIDITVAIDKADKIGRAGVEMELADKGLNESQIQKVIYMVFFIRDSIKNKDEIMTDVFNIVTANGLDVLENNFSENNIQIGLQGIQEIRNSVQYFEMLSANKNGISNIEIDITLARGLTYYTGVIMEVMATGVQMGSIGGGGRYDDLTGLFGLKGISGVGISFGIDRIYDVLEELKLFPEQVAATTQALLVNFGGENEKYALQILVLLRAAGIAAEIYPDAVKFDKQMKYANKRGIKYVLLPGDEEKEKQQVSLKNFVTGEQRMLTINDCIDNIKNS